MAKQLPQFISENNKVDTVVLDYEDYENMYVELKELKELAWEYEVLHRFQEADKDPDEIPDNELFENE